MPEQHPAHFNPGETHLKTACGRWLHKVRNWTIDRDMTTCRTCRSSASWKEGKDAGTGFQAKDG